MVRTPRRITASIVVFAVVVAYGFWNEARARQLHDQQNEGMRDVVQIICRTNTALIEHDSHVRFSQNTIADPERIAILRRMVIDLRRLKNNPCGVEVK